MNKIIGIIAVALTLSSQAMADVGSSTKTTCTAQYGEGYSWLVVEIIKKEVCLRCTEGYPQVLINAKVSVPYGPRGTYITQNYVHTGTQHYRLSESQFKKVGTPTGPTSGEWADWFPQDMQILSVPSQPLYIQFKGESLELDCSA